MANDLVVQCNRNSKHHRRAALTRAAVATRIATLIMPAETIPAGVIRPWPLRLIFSPKRSSKRPRISSGCVMGSSGTGSVIELRSLRLIVRPHPDCRVLDRFAGPIFRPCRNPVLRLLLRREVPNVGNRTNTGCHSNKPATALCYLRVEAREGFWGPLGFVGS